jgi:hypothetical protein
MVAGLCLDIRAARPVGWQSDNGEGGEEEMGEG